MFEALPAFGPRLATQADLWATLPLAAVLAWLVAVDLRTLRLPDAGTLGLILAGLLLGLWRGEALSPALGAAVGWGGFAALGAWFHRRRGVEGLGLGDAKLLGAAGAWLGPVALPWVILCAAVPALVAALATGAARDRALPFGPWLAAAFLGLWLLSLAR